VRTYEELARDIRHATGIHDASALLALAKEMQALDTPKAQAAAFVTMGTAARLVGDYPAALEHIRRAMGLYEELGDRQGMAIAIGNMGNVHFRTGDFPSALEHYGRALAMHEEQADRNSIARVTGNMGNVYCDTGDFTAALEHYRRALAILEELGDRAMVATMIGNIGGVHFSTGDYLSAFEHLQRALPLHEELGDHAGVVVVTGNMIAALIKLERYDEAAVLAERQATMPMDNPNVRSFHLSSCALLAEHRDDLDAAHRHLMEAVSITTEAGLRASSAELHKRLRDLAQKRNDFAGFIEHNAEFLRLTEEIRGKEATQRLTMMEAERKAEAVERERQKERALLYGALPKSVADRMIRGEDVSGDHFDHAAVMFLDIVGFTSNTSTMPPADVVKLLEHIFSTIDGICETHNVIKIKTIGDSYMCFRGDADATTNAQSIARVGIAVMQGAFTWNDGEKIQFRGGMHIGTATAGVIGTQRLQYDVWGDTVNVASRMESTSEPGRIHVSEAFANVLRGSTNSAPYNLKQRGEVEIKGKGAMNTYWLESA
jgi:adenylate cyclase